MTQIFQDSEHYVPEMKNKSKNYPDFAERSTVLHQYRNLKMASSAHAYVRGNTLKFYESLAEAENRRVPQGPPVGFAVTVMSET